MSRRIGPPPTWDSDAFDAIASAPIGDIEGGDEESLIPALKEHETWLLNGEKGHVAVPLPGDMCCECPPDGGTGLIGAGLDAHSRCGSKHHRRWGVPSAGVEGIGGAGEHADDDEDGGSHLSELETEEFVDDGNEGQRGHSVNAVGKCCEDEVGDEVGDEAEDEAEDGDESGGEAGEVVEDVEESVDGVDEGGYESSRDDRAVTEEEIEEEGEHVEVESDYASDDTSTVGSGAGGIGGGVEMDEDDDTFVGALRARMKKLDVTEESTGEPAPDSFLLELLGD